MNTTNKFRSLLLGCGAILALAGTAPAYAVVDSGSASAFGLDANVLSIIDVGPTPTSSVSGNGSDMQSLLTLNAGLPGISLSTGLLNTSASSNVDGSSGSKSATGMSSIADFDLDATSFGLSFDTLTSDSTVSGDAGSFSAVGNSSIVNLMGTGQLSGINVNITGEPNQVLLDLPIAQVIANRQTSSCSSFSCMLTTDALYVNITAVGSLTLASSTAELMGSTAPIPEPSTYAMMVIGLVGIGAARKWKNRSA